MGRNELPTFDDYATIPLLIKRLERHDFSLKGKLYMSIFSRFSIFWQRRPASAGFAVVALLANLLVLPFSQVSAGNDTIAAATPSGVTVQRIFRITELFRTVQNSMVKSRNYEKTKGTSLQVPFYLT